MSVADYVVMISSGITALATVVIAFSTCVSLRLSKHEKQKTEDLLMALVVSNMVHGGQYDAISVKQENFKKYYKGKTTIF